MFLHPDAGLAEVPGFGKEQLDALACSVELRRQQLEQDIQDYIKRRQDELRQYEQEVHPPTWNPLLQILVVTSRRLIWA
jgi:hypothetical protein